ncbi:MAG: Maf family protein [Myxococcaceae bacterium]
MATGPSPRLVLASASPRRRELLAQLGLVFEVAPSDIDETPRTEEDASAYVTRLAEEKARLGLSKAGETIVLAADTTVCVQGALLGKPRDDADALRMLSRLSGTTHEVLTAVAVATPKQLRSKCVSTAVKFRALSDAEMRWYVRTGEPQGKAGAYAVQGIASAFVLALQGSYTNVVGLPLAETLELLADAGLSLPWSTT